MYKLVVFAALLAVATAAPGLIGAGYAAPVISHGYADPWGHGYGAPWGHGYAPLVSAPVVKAAVPVATSYSNSVRIATPSVVAAHAPYVAAHAPYVAAHAPYVAAPAYAHGW